MFLFCKCDDALLLRVVAGVGNGTGVIHVITLQLFYRLDYPMVLRRHICLKIFRKETNTFSNWKCQTVKLKSSRRASSVPCWFLPKIPMLCNIVGVKTYKTKLRCSSLFKECALSAFKILLKADIQSVIEGRWCKSSRRWPDHDEDTHLTKSPGNTELVLLVFVCWA